VSGWAALPLAVSLIAAAAWPQRLDTSTTGVVRAAASYVAEYQRQLTSIIADEIYTQQIAEQQPREADMPRARHLRSEVFFMFAPADRDWMAIRDVKAVDGTAVEDPLDLGEALRTLPPVEVATQFKRYNSRYNIGRTVRNFNEPTLSLLVLDEHHRDRFSFDRKQVRRSGDAVLVTLRFTERRMPTLIHDPNVGPLFSSGELVIEAGTGRVRSAVLNGSVGGERLQLTTTFAPDERLGIWVPALFREEYEFVAPPRSREHPEPQYENVLCEATYTNFRRFATSGRVK
jgi:hypothetical protein